MQGISHAIKSVVINSNFKIFAGSKPPDPQIKLASLAPGPPPIKNPGYAPGQMYGNCHSFFRMRIDEDFNITEEIAALSLKFYSQRTKVFEHRKIHVY